MARKIDSREYGLEFGLIFAEYFLGTDDLHYGLWTGDLEPTVHNLPRAQRRYTEALIGAIPEGVSRILDVGCGSGSMALELLRRGYEVDCVSPSALLVERARDKLGSRADVFHCRFENLDTSRRYDLVLFSESFQYIPMRRALKQAARYLDGHGHVLICDFFQARITTGAPLGGGQPWHEFPGTCEATGFSIVSDVDITAQVAPTVDVFNDMAQRLVRPSWNLAGDLLRRRVPRLSRFLRWLLRRRLEKIEQRYMSGERTSERFSHYKTYHRILLQA